MLKKKMGNCESHYDFNNLCARMSKAIPIKCGSLELFSAAVTLTVTVKVSSSSSKVKAAVTFHPFKGMTENFGRLLNRDACFAAQ